MEINKEQALEYLQNFIDRMTACLQAKEPRDREEAPTIFWENKYPLQQVAEWIKGVDE